MLCFAAVHRKVLAGLSYLHKMTYHPEPEILKIFKKAKWENILKNPKFSLS